MSNVAITKLVIDNGEIFVQGEHYKSAFVDNYSVVLTMNDSSSRVVQKSHIVYRDEVALVK